MNAPVLENGRWIQFRLIGDTGKTLAYEVGTMERQPTILGTIKWYGPWRCYAFFPGPGTLFETDCLWTIQAALLTLNEHRKAQRAGKVA